MALASTQAGKLELSGHVPCPLLNLDSDEYQMLSRYDFDFFIVNHIIEHLIYPISFLKQIHNVMESGSALYLVPDLKPPICSISTLAENFNSRNSKFPGPEGQGFCIRLKTFGET